MLLQVHCRLFLAVQLTRLSAVPEDERGEGPVELYASENFLHPHEASSPSRLRAVAQGLANPKVIGCLLGCCSLPGSHLCWPGNPLQHCTGLHLAPAWRGIAAQSRHRPNTCLSISSPSDLSASQMVE